MTVKPSAKLFLTLLYLLFSIPVALSAAPQHVESGVASFDNIALKIEKLTDSNVPLAQSELQRYEARFNELSLKQKITYKYLLAQVYTLQAQYHLVEQSASDGLSLTLNLSSPSLLISKLLYSRGFAYESIGNIELATKDYESGLELAKSLHDSVLIARGLMSLGAIYYLTDRYESSLTVLNDAYNIAKKTDDEELKGDVNSELGILYSHLDRNEQSMVYYQQAYQYYKEANKVIPSLNALVNIGANYLSKKEYEQAIITYKMIINEPEGAVPNQTMYNTFSGLAWANLKKEDPNQEASYQYLLLSKLYMEGIEQYDIEFQYYFDEAFVLFELERFDEAIDSITAVEIILAEQMPLSQLKKYARISLTNLKAKTYFKLGSYQQAYDLQEQRLSLIKALRDKEHIQSVAEVRLALEAKKADLHKQVLKNNQKLQEVALLDAKHKQEQQRLYLFYIAIVALIFAWLLIKLIQVQRKLHKASSIDMLTGIANRKKLMRKAKRLLQRSKAKQSDVSVIMIDIDHFKKINDEFGHNIGDQVLKEVVKLGEGFMRKTDVFGRFSGEEFIVFLPNTSTAQAKMIAERFRASVEKHSWQISDVLKSPFTASISIGVASSDDISSDKKYDLTALIKKADTLLYQTKTHDRNKVCNL